MTSRSEGLPWPKAELWRLYGEQQLRPVSKLEDADVLVREADWSEWLRAGGK